MAVVSTTSKALPATSFYPALERLLTEIGKRLSPKVRCVIHIANQGAGLPDGGLFSADQLRRTPRNAGSKENPLLVQAPSRGVIEAKAPSDDVGHVAESEQVGRYWKRYGAVLVTNFRAFALVGSDADGRPCVLESFSLADSENEFWTLAVLHASAFRAQNAGGLRQDWPRIPLPHAKDALLASAALGREVAALLDTETPVPGVTADRIRDELKRIAVFRRVDGKSARPEAGDLDLTAGWGHAGKSGVTMPGKGKLVPRDDGTSDVFLNDVAYWGDVPKAVWDFTIGGYQVIKKWLSYREKSLLGRALTPDEVRHVTDMARRLAALIALRPALDSSYSAVTKNTYPWPQQ